MSGGELAVVLASVAVIVAVAILGALGVSLSRSLKELRRLLGEIRRDVVPAVERIEEASGRVTGEVQRVGGLLDVAERVSERAETLSSVTYRALLEPLGAVASLFRRGAPPDEPARAPRAASDTPRPARRVSWSRRLTAHLLRSGYRSASARIAARLAAAPAQRTADTTSRPARRGRTGAPPDAAAADLPLGRQLLESVRQVTHEISAAMEEGRQTLRADRRSERRPE